MQLNDFLIYHLPDLKPILKIEVIDVFVRTGKDIATLEIKPYGYISTRFRTFATEQEQEKQEIILDLLDALDPNIKESSCIKIDTLTEGKEYTLTHLQKKNSKKIKFFFRIADEPKNIYVSNPFLEEILENTQYKTKFKIRIGAQKRDKNKKLHCMVYV
jgi:hypothetical protein